MANNECKVIEQFKDDVVAMFKDRGVTATWTEPNNTHENMWVVATSINNKIILGLDARNVATTICSCYGALLENIKLSFEKRVKNGKCLIESWIVFCNDVTCKPPTPIPKCDASKLEQFKHDVASILQVEEITVLWQEAHFEGQDSWVVASTTLHSGLVWLIEPEYLASRIREAHRNKHNENVILRVVEQTHDTHIDYAVYYCTMVKLLNTAEFDAKLQQFKCDVVETMRASGVTVTWKDTLNSQAFWAFGNRNNNTNEFRVSLASTRGFTDTLCSAYQDASKMELCISTVEIDEYTEWLVYCDVCESSEDSDATTESSEDSDATTAPIQICTEDSLHRFKTELVNALEAKKVTVVWNQEPLEQCEMKQSLVVASNVYGPSPWFFTAEECVAKMMPTNIETSNATLHIEKIPSRKEDGGASLVLFFTFFDEKHLNQRAFEPEVFKREVANELRAKENVDMLVEWLASNDNSLSDLLVMPEPLKDTSLVADVILSRKLKHGGRVTKVCAFISEDFKSLCFGLTGRNQQIQEVLSEKLRAQNIELHWTTEPQQEGEELILSTSFGFASVDKIADTILKVVKQEAAREEKRSHGDCCIVAARMQPQQDDAWAMVCVDFIRPTKQNENTERFCNDLEAELVNRGSKIFWMNLDMHAQLASFMLIPTKASTREVVDRMLKNTGERRVLVHARRGTNKNVGDFIDFEITPIPEETTAEIKSLLLLTSDGTNIDFATTLKRDTIEGLLDGHGAVSLLDFAPRIVPKGRTPEYFVVRAARVSLGVGLQTIERDKKLLEYLLTNDHTSPIEMCSVTFRLTIPLVLLTQFLRHRTAKYCHINIFSQRYAEVPQALPNYNPLKYAQGVRAKNSINKQSSTDFMGSSKEDMDKITALMQDATTHTMTVDQLYHEMIRRGVASEIARLWLPGSQYTTVIMQHDLHNFLHLLTKRDDDHAQHETRVFARAMYDLCEPLFPTLFAAFENKRRGMVLSEVEVKTLMDAIAATTRKQDEEEEQKMAKEVAKKFSQSGLESFLAKKKRLFTQLDKEEADKKKKL